MPDSQVSMDTVRVTKFFSTWYYRVSCTHWYGAITTILEYPVLGYSHMYEVMRERMVI